MAHVEVGAMFARADSRKALVVNGTHDLRVRVTAVVKLLKNIRFAPYVMGVPNFA